jgi:hypothetical protein
MFDQSLPEPDALAEVDDATLERSIKAWFEVASAAHARGYAVLADLARRRCAEEDDDERNYWPADPWDCAGAQAAAAMNVGMGKARRRLEAAIRLRDQLPRTNALFQAGAITEQMVETIYWRTFNVTGEEVWAQLDAALADSHDDWGPLSREKLADAVDFWITLFDPLALRRTQIKARDRHVTIGDREDADGIVSLWGRMLATDAELLRKQLTAMANGVCNDDPRTASQRLADALGALAAKADHLACRCDNPSCPAPGEDARASNFVIHVLAEHAALALQPDPLIHGDGSVPRQPDPQPPADPEPPAEPTSFVGEPHPPAATAAESAPAAPASEPSPATARPTKVQLFLPKKPPTPPVRLPAGVMIGGGIVPAPLLAELIRNGAKIRLVQTPGLDAEPHYRPSTALAEFVRTRDLTCRAPGCNRPVDLADIDHSVPYPTGLTHPCNNNCKCKKHHLVKTFWSGEGGWAEQQLPDGTLLTTSPAGVTYRTRPGAALYFPGWDVTTPPHTGPPPKGVKPPGNDLESFKRKRTRGQDRERRINAERERNAAWIAVNPPRF